jgi:hypothetical protein
MCYVVRSLVACRNSTPDDLVAAGVMVPSAVEVRRIMAFSDVAPRCEEPAQKNWKSDKWIFRLTASSMIGANQERRRRECGANALF